MEGGGGGSWVTPALATPTLLKQITTTLESYLVEVGEECPVPAQTCHFALEKFRHQYVLYLDAVTSLRSELVNETSKPKELQRHRRSQSDPTIQRSNICISRKKIRAALGEINTKIDEINAKIVSLRDKAGDEIINQNFFVNNAMEIYIQDHEKELISQACKTKGTTIVGLLRRGSSADLVCLGKLSDFWSKSEDLMVFLRRHPSPIENLLAQNNEYQNKLLGLMFLKNIRAALAKSYFNDRFISKVAQGVGISEGEIRGGMVGLGFNRLFSHSNSLGASPASDVDFNIVYDERKYSPDQNNSIRQILPKVLTAVAQEFKNSLGMTLEIADFTVRSRAEVMTAKVQGDNRKLNFYASTFYNNTKLFGSEALKSDIYENLFERINDPNFYQEVDGKAYAQYISPESDKGSIGVIKQVHKIRAAVEQMEKTNQTHDPIYLRYKNALKAFRGNYIGMPGVEGPGYEDRWTFSTKYSMLRLNDYAPHSAVCQNLAKTGSILQVLMVQELTRAGHSDQIDDRYDKITAQDFVNLYRYQHRDLALTIEKSCQQGIVKSEWWAKFKALGSAASEHAIMSFGESYFLNLFETADHQATALQPVFPERLPIKSAF